MDKFSRNEWLAIAIGIALGFMLCLVLIAAWPAGLEHHQHAANSSPDDRGTYYEIHKTWGSGLRP
jgi:zinc transporter ZupT